MKRVVVDHYGGPEVLRVEEADDPSPGPGEVRIRVLAAGVSFTDALLRAGIYLGGPKPPFTPGYELVGVVEELGAGCSRLRVGDRVAVLTVWGAGAELVYAALMVAAGAHPKYLQAQMGHSSIRVTLDLYGHLFPDANRSVLAQLDRLIEREPPEASITL